MNFKELEIQGCFLFELSNINDMRGTFLKTFHQPSFSNTPLTTFELREEFYTVSQKYVVRGMHFQIPPKAHNKIVTCISGRVIDFFLDIRKDSETYGKTLSIELSGQEPKLLYLPKGIAHGFYSCEDHSAMLYKTDEPYAPDCDRGILWNSVGIKVPNGSENLIVSDRDLSFPLFDEFRSPF